MRWIISASILLMVFASSLGSARTMNQTSRQSPRCSVVDGGKLPAESGGAPALCAAIERAISQKAPGAHFTAEVRVLSPSRLTAILTRDGHALAEQKFASMDRDLTGHSFERFAQALAEQVAKGPD
ncbi:MAG: hypothetical protein ABIW03_07460 [Sphingomicrobium sp.]